MLNVKDLSVEINDKKILNNFNIEIKEGEIHAIMGPNGTGKSTLSKVILNDRKYNVTSGDIRFDSKSIRGMSTDQVAQLGIFVSFQNPISIEGVENKEFIRTAMNSKSDEKINLFEFGKMLVKEMDLLDMDQELLSRSVNSGSSGGERKKNEVLQLRMLKPKFIILDELDSGLDVDSLKSCTNAINEYLKENPKTSVLIITHYPRILEYIRPDYVHVMVNGNLVKKGDYRLALEIEEKGYSDF